MNINIDGDAKILLIIKSLEKYRDVITEYIDALKEVLELKTSTKNIIIKIQEHPEMSLNEDEMKKMFDVEEKVTFLPKKIEELQNKLSKFYSVFMSLQ